MISCCKCISLKGIEATVSTIIFELLIDTRKIDFKFTIQCTKKKLLLAFAMDILLNGIEFTRIALSMPLVYIMLSSMAGRVELVLCHNKMNMVIRD